MAESLGIDVKELADAIDDDWGHNNAVARPWLPAGWRDGRRLYSLQFGQGSWVDITHSDTLGALSHSMRVPLYELGVNLGLTLADITADDREITTTIARWLRDEVTLDDGSQPLGVRFQSKHGRHDDGDGLCWAFWMREADAGIPTTQVFADAGVAIDPEDPDYKYAITLHNLDSR